jgi:hypothetical protein
MTQSGARFLAESSNWLAWQKDRVSVLAFQLARAWGVRFSSRNRLR